MPVLQLISSRVPVLGNDGLLLKSAKIHVRDLNTSNAIVTYKDSALTSQNTAPVRTDGAGRASIWVGVNCDIRIEDKDNNLVDEELAVNPEAVQVTGSISLVPNGSFETDTDGDNEPDGWVKTDETGSANVIDATKSSHGEKSMKFVSTGSGGGNLITKDFFPVTSRLIAFSVNIDRLYVNVDIECSVVDVRVIVRVEWFDEAQASISNSDIYDEAAANPTTFQTMALHIEPPALARFAKLRLIGCDPSDATSGSCWFDNVNVFYILDRYGQDRYSHAVGPRTSTTLSDDEFLQKWVLEPDSLYRIEGYLAYTSAASAVDLKFRFTQSAVAQDSELTVVSIDTAGLVRSDHGTDFTATVNNVLTANLSHGFFFTGYVNTHLTNRSTVSFQWALQTAVGTVQLKFGSDIRFRLLGLLQ